MRVDEHVARARFTSARVARLGTVDDQGRPHLVPVTFAVRGDTIVTAVDHKPKQTTDLKRLRNITANPNVSLLADRYAEDWTRLWWVRVDGTARVVEPPGDGFPADAVSWLRAKYDQYRDTPPAGPVIRIDATAWTGWQWSDR